VVIFNLRQFLIGRFNPEAEWRIAVLALIIAFVMGWSLAAWGRATRTVVVILALVGILTVVVPPLVRQFVPVSPSYMAACETEIASCSVTQTAPPQVGFSGAAGETVTVEVTAEYGQGDTQLVHVFSFTDHPTNI